MRRPVRLRGTKSSPRGTTTTNNGTPNHHSRRANTTTTLRRTVANLHRLLTRDLYYRSVANVSLITKHSMGACVRTWLSLQGLWYHNGHLRHDHVRLTRPPIMTSRTVNLVLRVKRLNMCIATRTDNRHQSGLLTMRYLRHLLGIRLYLGNAMTVVVTRVGRISN